MSTTPPISKRMERGIIGLFIAAASIIALAFLLPAVRQIVAIASGQAAVSLLASADVPHDVGNEPTILSATFDSAWVVSTGLSDAARWLLAAGTGFGALTAAAIAGAAFYFVLLLMWKRPFHRSLVVATQIAGGSLLLGGLLSAGLGGLGRMMAASELNPLSGDIFVVGFAFEPAVLFAGIAVLALSYVFDRGTRLQRDTDGLV